MFVLDTNHVSELTYRTAAGLRLLQKLDASDQDVAVTAVTVEESLRGWLAPWTTHPEAAIARVTRIEASASGALHPRKKLRSRIHRL